MRAGITVLGIIFLVLGAIFYYIPVATTAAVGSTETGTSTVIAKAQVPAQISIAGIIIGALLLLLGLIMPDPQPKIYVENYPSSEYRTKHT